MFKALLIASLLLASTTGEVKVYKGRSNYRSDIRYTLDGQLTLEEFVAVWHAVMYGW